MRLYTRTRSDTDQTWDLIIRPRRKWFHLELLDLWRARDLILLFVHRDFVSQYKQTILGPAWFLIQPIMTTIMFSVIFGKLAQLPTDGKPMALFYMAGTICWSYFSECMNKTSQTFNTNANIFGKVYFPRLTVPISIVISNLTTFALQLALFLVLLAYYYSMGAEVSVSMSILLLPLLVVIMAALGLGTGVIVSALTTKYRDLRFLVTFGIQLAMYATPVAYPLSIVPDKWRALAILNPMAPVIETFRSAILGAGMISWEYLTVSAVTSALVLIAGITLFSHVESTFMDTV